MEHVVSLSKGEGRKGRPDVDNLVEEEILKLIT